jgi:hypothetical protein
MGWTPAVSCRKIATERLTSIEEGCDGAGRPRRSGIGRGRGVISQHADSGQAIEHMRTYKPDVYMPAHHDAPNNGVWRAIEPIFEALKSENPNIITVSKEYRTPVCFDTEFNIQRGR